METKSSLESKPVSKGENFLGLKAIGQLLGEEFYIPSYQRGYRWTKNQVLDLLNDIWTFYQSPTGAGQGDATSFYCLQPIVVSKREAGGWEVIDGQQRLTTIYLILKFLENLLDSDHKNFKSISYQTRPMSAAYLDNVDENVKDKNVDFHHIYCAHENIRSWFKEKANQGFPSARLKFLTPFLESTRVIWYEVNEASDAIDIFTRINIGKIPLTNAELVKALFLQKENFEGSQASLKQIQIASEWDEMEKKLQNDDFWYFIYNPNQRLKYDNRIEYIFDLIKNKGMNDEQYFTFHEFYKDFESSKINQAGLDPIWLEIKRYFLSFEEWYQNHELYHLVGFLIDHDKSIKDLKEKSFGITKTAFINHLKDEIRRLVACEVEELVYGDKKVKSVLLLFNIETILSTANTHLRFPFAKYKVEEWDIEHVRSQTEKRIDGKQRIYWALDVLEYLTGECGFSDSPVSNNPDLTEAQRQIEAIEHLIDGGEEKRLANELVTLLKLERIDDSAFERVYQRAARLFNEESWGEEMDNISNLALLDARTNRSYKNAMFPIKRKVILENDKGGIFIPLCTKNLFLKSYTKRMTDLMYWNPTDAQGYLDAIKTILINYLPKSEK